MKWISLFFMLYGLVCEGQVVQNFSLTNVVDEQSISLESFSSSPGVIIIFTGTNCPYDAYYIDRIRELTETYKSKIPMLLINSNANESTEKMKKFIEQNKLTTPYLIDKEQKVMASLKAHKSPECFLLQNTSGKFSIVYRGAIDDNAQAATEVNRSYLRDAIERLLTKNGMETSEVRPVGCGIRTN